ncbi:Telomerase reverse transcriptase [Mactra antiquata]
MEVINKKYKRVLQLQDWIDTSVVTVSKDLTEDAHCDSYKSLFTYVYVCENKEPRTEPLQISTGSNLHDVIFTVIGFILKKHGAEKNILTSGFRLLTENTTAQQCSASVESLNFNSCVKRFFDDAWQTFLSRFGDTVFMYLIRHTSLFLKISDSCFVQLTGESICNVPKCKYPQNASKVKKNSYTASLSQSNIYRAKKRSQICYSGVTKQQRTKWPKKYEQIQEEMYQQLKRDSYLFANGKSLDVESDDVTKDIMGQKSKKRSRNHDDEDNRSLIEPPMKKQKINDNIEQTIYLKQKTTVCVKESFISYHVALPRNNILFIRNPREKFSKTAMMSSLETTAKSLHTMYVNIFCKSPLSVDNKSKGVKIPDVQDIERLIYNDVSTSDHHHDEEPMLAKIIPLLKEFIDNHRRCPYKRFLTIHCPVPCNYKHKNRSTKHKGIGKRLVFPTASRLLASHVHYRKVFLFLRLCIQYVLPDGLFGRSHNINTILKNVSRLISLGRREKITLGQIMNGMKTKEVYWLTGTKSNNMGLSYLAFLLYWWFTEYIFMILRTYFYITDTSFLRYKLVYYRQTTWNLLQTIGVKGLLGKGIIKAISEKCCTELVRTRKSLGVSSLRFLPKPKSLRPIINMGRLIQVASSRTISVNKQLSSTHSILSYLKNKNPSIIGHGAFGLDDVYTTLQSYIQKWKCHGKPKLYFVKTDITNCYDSMNQQKLLRILKETLSKEMAEEEFVIRKYFSIFLKSGDVKKQFHQVVSPMSEFNVDFISYCQDIVKIKDFHNVVFVDSVVYQRETMVSLLWILEALLFKTIIKIGGQYYKRLCGISQGSVLSTLLCNIYYTGMEHEYINVDNNELLMRIVDDYLLVTPHYEHAARFADTMITGIDEYNCVTNQEKVLLNFNHSINDEPLPLVSGEWFPWCGVQINMNTLEVTLDCSRYSGTSIRDTLTIELSKNPGQTLKEKMKMSVSRKFHPIYVDRLICTETQMLTNIYQIFLTSALKMHSGIHQLPYKERADKKPLYFYGIVKEMVHTMAHLINKLKQDKFSDSNLKLVDTISWICHHACYVVFKRYHSQYSLILKKLEYEMKKMEKKLNVNEKEKLTLLVSNGYSSDLMNCLP